MKIICTIREYGELCYKCGGAKNCEACVFEDSCNGDGAESLLEICEITEDKPNEEDQQQDH